MRFSGGGIKIFDLIKNFYQENEIKVKDSLEAEDFGIILDWRHKRICNSNSSTQRDFRKNKQTAINVLE